MEVEDFIKDLNLVLKTEYGAVLQYIIQTYRFSKKGFHKEANELLTLCNDEIRHAEALAEKIKGFGEEPTTEAEWPSDTDNIEKLLRLNLRTEKESVEIYKKLVIIAEKEGFMGLKELLEAQLADEIRHMAKLEKFLVESY